MDKKIEATIEDAIKAVRDLYHRDPWRTWARGFLDKTNRSPDSAKKAAEEANLDSDRLRGEGVANAVWLAAEAAQFAATAVYHVEPLEAVNAAMSRVRWIRDVEAGADEEVAYGSIWGDYAGDSEFDPPLLRPKAV